TEVRSAFISSSTFFTRSGAGHHSGASGAAPMIRGRPELPAIFVSVSIRMRLRPRALLQQSLDRIEREERVVNVQTAVAHIRADVLRVRDSPRDDGRAIVRLHLQDQVR